MNSYYGWGLPIDISAHGAQIDQLIIVLHVFMILLFVGWFIFLTFTLIKFRKKDGVKPDYHQKHYKIPTYLEIFVAFFEVLLLLAFSIPIANKVRYTLPDESKAFKVHVLAEQFAWNIHYPGPDGIFGKTSLQYMKPGSPVGLDPSDPNGKDDLVTINQLNIPVNKPVIVNLTSKDVIHSFSLPVMRIKQDAIPGQMIPVWFEAKQTGKFEIACAQLCGLGHYRMRGFFNVMTDEELAKWFQSKLPKKPKEVVNTVVSQVATSMIPAQTAALATATQSSESTKNHL